MNSDIYLEMFQKMSFIVESTLFIDLKDANIIPHEYLKAHQKQ